MIRATPERTDRRPALAIGAIAGLLLGFLILAIEMQAGDTAHFDAEVLLSLRSSADPDVPFGPFWLAGFARDVTSLGGTGVLLAMTLGAAGYLWVVGRPRAAGFVLLAVFGGQAISSLVKLGFNRPRPDLVLQGVETFTASFPSGHAMMSTVTYFTLAALFARDRQDRAAKAYILAVAAVLALAIGTSRVYLAVHWPTDVLAGWMLGGAWVLSCIVVTEWLRSRRANPPGREGDRPAPAPPPSPPGRTPGG